MISITVDGQDYDVPSSAADTNWAAAQVAFEQALAEAVNTAADDVAALETDVTALTADVSSLSAATKPPAVVGTAGSGAGITGASTAYGRNVVHKITVGFDAVATAGTTNDVTIWTVPAKTRVLRVVADVTTEFSGGAIATCDLVVGTGGDEYLLTANVFSGTGTYGLLQNQLGDKVASGAGFTGDFTSWSAPVAIIAGFASTGANLDDLSQGSATFYIEVCTYP